MASISVARRAVAAQMARLAFQKKKHNVFPRISWRSWCARRYLTSNLTTTALWRMKRISAEIPW